MISEVTATVWLNVAYEEWLFGCDYSSNLREPTRGIVMQMQQVIAREDKATAEQLMNMLRGLSSRFTQDPTGSTQAHSYEMAETLVECGRATYSMSERLTALQFFDESAQRYKGHDHCRAAVLWMLGCVQWLYSTRVQEAIVSWESSLELFEHLEARSNRAELAAWYQFWREEMRSALRMAMAGGDQMPPVNRPSWPRARPRGEANGQAVAAPTPPPPPPPPGRTSRVARRSDVLRSFAVYGSIPAGGFKTSPKPVAYTEVERFCIEGQEYELHNLWGASPVTLRKDFEHVAVFVDGDSMNRKNILDGDYVLLRVQEDADHGDIVAVTIDDDVPDDEKASLKQLFRRDGKIVLEPQSTKEYPKFVFEEKDRHLHIRGVAVAVLKRVEE